MITGIGQKLRRQRENWDSGLGVAAAAIPLIVLAAVFLLSDALAGRPAAAAGSAGEVAACAYCPASADEKDTHRQHCTHGVRPRLASAVVRSSRPALGGRTYLIAARFRIAAVDASSDAGMGAIAPTSAQSETFKSVYAATRRMHA